MSTIKIWIDRKNYSLASIAAKFDHWLQSDPRRYGPDQQLKNGSA
jgi:hypothetical protein